MDDVNHHLVAKRPSVNWSQPLEESKTPAPAKLIMRNINVTQVQSSTAFTKKSKKKKVKESRIISPIIDSVSASDPTDDNSGEWWKVIYTIFNNGNYPHNKKKCHSGKAAYSSNDPDNIYD